MKVDSADALNCFQMANVRLSGPARYKIAVVYGFLRCRSGNVISFANAAAISPKTSYKDNFNLFQCDFKIKNILCE